MSKNCRGRVGLMSRNNRSVIALAVTAAVYGVCGVSPNAIAANSELDVLNGATDLTNAASYLQNLTPVASSDLTFTTGTAYSPAVFTINGNTTLNAGTLNAVSTTPISISNVTASTAATLTLNGGANSVAGAQSGDLLYVASGGSLTVGSAYSSTTPTGTLGVTLASGGNFDIAGSATINSSITGNGSGFTKSGAGVLTVNAAMTNTGAVTISSGTLRLGTNGPSLASGSYLVLDANSGVTLSGSQVTGWTDQSGNGRNATSKTGTVTKGTLSNGSAALVFNGSSYLQDLTASASLNNLSLFAVIQPTSATATGAIVGSSVAGGGGIEFRTTSAKLDVLDQGVADYGSSSAVLTTNPQVVGLTFTNGSQNFYVNGASVGSTSTAGNFTASRTLQIGGSVQGEQFNGKISAIVEYSSVLSADQITQIQQRLSDEFLGTSYGNSGSLSSTAPVNITSSGAALDLNGLSQSVAALSGVSGSSVYLGGASLTVGSDNTDSNFAGSISDTGGASSSTGGALIKTGSGMFTLSNANTYTGATSVNSGSITLASGGSIASSALSIASGATLTMAGTNQLVATAAVTDNGSFNVSGSGTTLATLNGTGSLYVSPTGSLTVNAGTLSGSVNLTSGGTLTKASAGVLLLSGVNTFSGSTVISAGTLQLSTPGMTIGSGATFTANSTGTLYFLAGGAQLAASDISAVLAKTTGNSGSAIAIDTTAGSLTYANNLPAGAYGFTKAGANALTLSGSSAYTGPTAISGGQLFIANASAIPSVSTLTLNNNTILDLAPTAASGTLNPFPVAIATAGVITQIQSDVPTSGPGINYTLGNVTSVAGTFNIASGANVVGGSPSITVGSVSLNSTTAGATTVFNPNTASLTIGSIAGTAGTTHSVTLNGAGVGTVTGPITDGAGATSIRKDGPSVWTLNGTETYTGLTTVANGQLVLNGQINNSSTLLIAGSSLNVAAALYQSGAGTNLTTLATSATAVASIVGGQGYYSLTGGTLNIAGELDISGTGASTNTFGQVDINGGTVNLGVNGGAAALMLNRSTVAGTAAVLNVIGGGVVRITGGATPVDTVTNGLGADWGNSVSTITVGAIGATALSGTVSIPSLTVKLNHGFSSANANGSTGAVSNLNLNGGGVLQTLGFLSPVAANNANVAINFNGGTLKAGTAGNSSFLQNLGGAYIYSGGGTIDDNGQNITIAQPLLAPSGLGVTSVTVGTAGSGYIAPPKVTFSGVTGATGYATISQTTGAVTGIVITNPGFGASSPTVTLTTATSGFTGTAASNFTVNTATDISGGLIKAGVGTLTLAGSSTYTGTTNISAGTLALDHSGSNLGSLASPVTVAGNAALLVKGSTGVGSLSTIGTGAALNLSDGALNTLTVNGNLAIASGSVLSFDVSGSGIDMISATGTAAVTGTSSINITGTSIASGSYVLLNAAGGGLNANGAGFTVVGHPAGRFNSFSLSSSTSTQEILTVSATAFASTNYWTGAASRAAGDTAYNWSTGTANSNFSTDAAGTVDQNQIPGPVTDVIFTASNAKPSSGSTLTTRLDNPFVINGLSFAVPITSAQITSTVINLNGNTLTLGGDGLALTADSLSGGTLGTGSLILSSNQNWANNNATLPLTINSNISSGSVGGTTLTLNGTGNGGLTLGGVISDGAGPLNLAFSQSGTTTLGGSNSFTGGSTISAGTVRLANATGLAAGQVVFNDGQIDVAGFSPTFTSLSGSGGTITNSGATATVTVNAGNYSGTISNGTGQVGLTKTTSGSFTLGGTSSYTGSTNITAGTLQLGSSTASSTGSPLVVAGPGTLDLNGNAASYASLTGSGTVTNSGGSATLTLSTAGTSTFSGRINDGGGQTNVVFVGTGVQNLTGSSGYSGGTTVTSGKLGVYSSTAMGTGTVQLNGGVLSLGGAAAVVNNVKFNGSAAPVGSGLQLTNGGASQSGSVFLNNPIQISDSDGFSASFTYTTLPGPDGAWADGAAFVLQNDSRGSSALGSNGSTLGYGGGAGVAITPSAAVFLNTYSPGGGQTNFDTNGQLNIGSNLQLPGIETSTGPGFNNSNSTLTGGGVVLTSGHPIQITLTYNGSAQTLQETLIDPVTGGTFTTTYSSVDLASILGGSAGGSQSAYIGFTGATGGISSTQTISNFSVQTGSTPVALTSAATYTNNVVAVSGTTSGIELVPNTGLTPVVIGNFSLQQNSSVKLTNSTPATVSRGVLVTTGLSMSGGTDSWTSRLDLTKNALDVQNGDLATISNQVKQGYGNGGWQGSGGITSSTAAADATHLTALGVIQNSVDGTSGGTPLYGSGAALGLFSGYSPSNSDVLVKYTYYGDANLDGRVDGSDYSLIDNAFVLEQTGGSPISGWYSGDFNYDGIVNGSDYTLLDNAYNTQGAILNSSIAVTPTAQIAGGASVPEPTSLGLIAAIASGLLGRRRRK